MSGALLGLVLLGCTQAITQAPVTVVATRTPGVSFVIVRPYVMQGKGTSRSQPGDNKQVDPGSWYLLLCDARPADGMHCSIPSEAALSRYSYSPNLGAAPAAIDEGVGTLADISTHVSKDKEEPAAASAAASAAAAPLPPPPPPPPPPAAGGKEIRP